MYDHKNGCCFKKLSREDLPSLRKLKEDSWTTTHHVAFVNDDDQERWFNSIPSNVQHFICFRREDHPAAEYTGETLDEHIGLLSLTFTDTISRVAQIGGSIFAKHRGTEWSLKAWEAGTDFAFEMFNLHRIEGEVLENNLAALGMDLRLGYKIEGVRRQAVYKSGMYHDSYIIGYLRSDWELSATRRCSGICNTNYKHRKPSEKLFKRLGLDYLKKLSDTIIAPVIDPIIKINDNDLTFEDAEQHHQAVS